MIAADLADPELLRLIRNEALRLLEAVTKSMPHSHRQPDTRTHLEWAIEKFKEAATCPP